MIRFSVLYPAGDDATFDHDYYRNTHIPLCQRTWEPVATTIEKGVDGPYVAAVHFTFESPEAMQAAIARDGMDAIRADVANYTNIEPVLQTSEVVE